MEMNVKDIVRQWLNENGYDGLSSEECGCELADLMPCDEPNVVLCVAGHRGKCNPETCAADGDCPWHIIPGKKPNEQTTKDNTGSEDAENSPQG